MFCRNDTDIKSIRSTYLSNQMLLLPRPCDFGILYSELVLSNGITILVDDATHENVFELQPIGKFVPTRYVYQPLQQSRSQERQQISNKTTTQLSTKYDETELTDVSSLLQTDLLQYQPQTNVDESAKILNTLLYNRPDF